MNYRIPIIVVAISIMPIWINDILRPPTIRVVGIAEVRKFKGPGPWYTITTKSGNYIADLPRPKAVISKIETCNLIEPIPGTLFFYPKYNLLHQSKDIENCK